MLLSGPVYQFAHTKNVEFQIQRGVLAVITARISISTYTKSVQFETQRGILILIRAQISILPYINKV